MTKQQNATYSEQCSKIGDDTSPSHSLHPQHCDARITPTTDKPQYISEDATTQVVTNTTRIQPPNHPPCYRDCSVGQNSDTVTRYDRMSISPPLYSSQEIPTTGQIDACAVHRPCMFNGDMGDSPMTSIERTTYTSTSISDSTPATSTTHATPAYHHHIRTVTRYPPVEELSVADVPVLRGTCLLPGIPTDILYTNITQPLADLSRVTPSELQNTSICLEADSEESSPPPGRLNCSCTGNDYVMVSRLGTCMVVTGMSVVLASLLLFLMYRLVQYDYQLVMRIHLPGNK